jgi:hypothetical protein
MYKYIYLVVRISVARVRPRTSKGITDLLLPQLPCGCTQRPSKKLACLVKERQATI